ncbi:expressed unknown protein [Seminavis robusta]|uniref:Uncharacterized protein n=1 Tax=Seminavis robusta TaxID=568900 RepID=A0A9N8DCT1_9STRA|nr:expressed unknown protein [Seminavis robusta]|eukprot:Sro84_g044750.1 n/a (104) ;mRNA; r:45459-45915
MKSTSIIASALLVCLAYLSTASAFAPKALVTPTATRTMTQVYMGVFDGEQERQQLTRDSEPEEFFQTNTDKMSDGEKLPIALAGVAFIALPFIAGLIALYSAR